MILVTSIIVAAYCLIILAFIVGFDLVKSFNATINDHKQQTFSIIIPFRNESEVLPKLLESIAQLDYAVSHYEVIFVDDASDDHSVEIIKEYFDEINIPFSILSSQRTTNSPKKDAINTAIQRAKYDWIITTDADCIVPKKWLQTLDFFIHQKQPYLIAAPVTYEVNSSFLHQFQLLDFLSLQGSTIGGFGIKKPFLCNGANLCYQKAVFFEVNGFEGNTQIASGDDIFLLEKLVKTYHDKVHYLKSRHAIVTTQPQPSFKQLVAQRVRWAAKSTAYKTAFSSIVSVVVFAMNFFLLLLLIGSLFGVNSWRLLAGTFLIKFILDLMLFIKTTTFFKQVHVLKHVVLSSFVYPFFVLYIVLLSLNSGYTWKGRTFKQ